MGSSIALESVPKGILFTFSLFNTGGISISKILLEMVSALDSERTLSNALGISCLEISWG